MVAAATTRFGEDEGIEFAERDLMDALGDDLGRFDLVVSSLAIHHLPDARKRSLCREVFELLAAGGAFYNLDCVASPSEELHEMSQRAFGFDIRRQDPSDQLAPLDDQLRWLREAGFDHVACHWKWLELAVFGGIRAS
jgi:SAM-dependent methyltransferase